MQACDFIVCVLQFLVYCLLVISKNTYYSKVVYYIHNNNIDLLYTDCYPFKVKTYKTQI